MRSSTPISLAAIAMLAAPSLTLAALKDVGPVVGATGFPAWYRDTNGVALSLCTEQRGSPNAEAGGAPMCFPVVPDPAGYAGNLGGEIFYYNASTSLTGANGFDMLWEGAIEATYANGTPIRGEEITFARIRIVMHTGVEGTYRVYHPYGVETFPDVPVGKRAVFYTVDVGINQGIFSGALAGAVGPWLEWDQNVANPAAPFGFDVASGAPYQLSIGNPDGSSVQFLGDPNLLHSVTGSPFLTNKVRVEGPPGSNLDGAGNDFIETNLFAVLGQRYTAPIPSPLAVSRAMLSVDRGITQVDVIARSVPGARLLATATNVPSSELTADPVTGEAYSHVEFVAQGAIPSTLIVTNLSDNPHSAQATKLTDVVQTGPATLFPDYTGQTAGTITLLADSSVHTSPAPALTVLELPGIAAAIPDPATPWLQQFTASIPLGSMPPWQLTVESSLGGRRAEPVVFGAGGVLAPIAANALPANLVTSQGVSASFLALDPSSPTALPMVLNPPANGTAVVNLDGTITYTPKNLWNGADAFTYVLAMPDPSNPARTIYSNAADVAVTVVRLNLAPTAVADLVTMTKNGSLTFNASSNDTDLDGTVVPASVAIVTPPPVGVAVANGNGTITYTPPLEYTGQLTFTYVIQDNEGAVSAPGTVTVTVNGIAERLTISKALWTASTGRYTIVGNSTIFGFGIANTVTAYQGVAPALGPVIGSGPIDSAGKFTIDTTSAVRLDATNRVTLVSTGGATLVVTMTRK